MGKGAVYFLYIFEVSFQELDVQKCFVLHDQFIQILDLFKYSY